MQSRGLLQTSAQLALVTLRGRVPGIGLALTREHLDVSDIVDLPPLWAM